MIDIVNKLESVSFVIPGSTTVSVTLPLDDYLQTNYAQEELNVSLVHTDVLEADQLVAGEMPQKPHEAVLDKAIADKFLRDGLGKAVGLDSVEKFIGRRITIPNLDDYKIVGISDTESPSLFVDSSQVMYILSNANSASEDYSIMGDNYEEYEADAEYEDSDDAVRSGKVMDLDLAKNKIEIKKGEKPDDKYETIINAGYEDEISIGRTVNTKVGGHKLKVVGYYTSDSADDDTYYVDSSTIRADYISKQKDFTAYAPNTKQLKSLLDKDKGKVNFVREYEIVEFKFQPEGAILIANWSDGQMQTMTFEANGENLLSNDEQQ